MIRLQTGRAEAAVRLRAERMVETSVQRQRKYLGWRELEAWREGRPNKGRFRSSVSS